MNQANISTHAVPIQVVGRAGTTPPPQFATFYWVTPDGAIEQQLATVPVENDQAVYTGDPRPTGSRWAITVQDAGGLPNFRSGPLAALPGSALPQVPASRIRIYRSDGFGSVGLDEPDGVPEVARESLAHLPDSLRAVRISRVTFSGDAAGHEILTVAGRLRFFFFRRAFTYARLVTPRPQPHPGFPASIAVFDAGGPDIATGFPLGNTRRLALSVAIGESILAQFDAALKHVAELQALAEQLDFPAEFVSVTSLQVTTGSQPRLRFVVHSGAISPGITGPIEHR